LNSITASFLFSELDVTSILYLRTGNCAVPTGLVPFPASYPGLKPALVLLAQRGAEAPLFHLPNGSRSTLQKRRYSTNWMSRLSASKKDQS
jgi:hypothetical protein